ncbi:LLM class flavin-dependent oxidoreductase [Planosporangium flavigriseum]|uniref:5,10-methylenetetrahydromethanopterin reductase n=1 Tax=Planosporangium flavigriseum TaxID=373681 RepID=A0A8J3LTI6_9ACTN|nr:LLM class flavin-dependent oxidoreductase [Planosporangium flavigriseum]NJC65760.1 LLM class flavin-dependent oxidoreductase [Planosporangium flavigriseum]GIG73614.1 5,10-methylenetetrahydromethanopterin reductase [Planosporangium flavigriseum]
MRLAYSLSGQRDLREAVALTQTAEASGFDEVWVTEDYFERGAFTAAAAIAMATTRVRIGVGVVNPWTRHPMLTAMEHASLDELSGGRAILGLGASNARWMEEMLGIPFTQPLPRLRESVEILRKALAGEAVRHDGDGWRVDARLSFRPVRTNPPIHLGVKGRHALALAGEIADGVLLSLLSSPAYVTWARERIERTSCDVGAYLAFACGPASHRAEIRDSQRPLVARFLGIHGVHDITKVAGIEPELAERFRAAWRSGEPAVDLVTDDMLDMFTAAGTTDDVVASFARFRDAGLTTIVVRDDPAVPDPSRLIADAAVCLQVAAS